MLCKHAFYVQIQKDSVAAQHGDPYISVISADNRLDLNWEQKRKTDTVYSVQMRCRKQVWLNIIKSYEVSK